MPAKSKAQRGMMGADLARAKAGKPTKTGMAMSQLEDFAGTAKQGLPQKVSAPKPVSKAKGEKNQPVKAVKVTVPPKKK